MTTSGGIGGLPTEPAVDRDCPTCCGGGSGGSPSFGEVVTFDSLIASITANNAQTNMRNGGGEYTAPITNPLSVDAWVSGVFQIGDIEMDIGAYAGPLHYRHQFQPGPSNTISLPALALNGGVSTAGAAGPSAPGARRHFTETLERPVGFLLPAGATETLAFQHYMWLADDGSMGNYPIVFNQDCRFVYSGVPVA